MPQSEASDNRLPCRDNIVLIGFMGSGKSAVGRGLAKSLGFQFLDTDQLIVDRTGRQISEIFAEEGEPFFRQIETETIESLGSLNRCVISTGGGAVLSARNRALLRELGYVVCLTASEEVLFERVSRNTKRPLLQTTNPRETLARLISERGEIYRTAAHHTLDTSHISQNDAVDELTAMAKRAFAWTPTP